MSEIASYPPTGSSTSPCSTTRPATIPVRLDSHADNSAAAWAQWYLTKNINPLPIPYRSKNPNRKGWPNERYSESALPSAFPTPSNLGLLLGENGFDLTDVDLDCDEAVKLAPYFLPETNWTIGRSTRPNSHLLYRCANSCTVKFADPLGKRNDSEKGKIVEFLSTGAQVLSAPSVHPDDGETYVLQADGEIPLVNFADLQLAVQRLAATSLLARHWPAAGNRHAAALALAGVLLTSGIAQDWVKHIVHHAAWAAGDDELDDRGMAVQTTAARLAAGEPITSWAEAEQAFDPKVVRKAVQWLGGQSTGQAAIPHREDGDVGLELTNIVGSGTERQPLPLPAILDRIQEIIGDQLFQVANTLTVRDVRDGVRALKGTSDLFAYLQNQLIVRWHRTVGCVTKDELFAALMQNVKSFSTVEWLPHEPNIPDVLYLSAQLESGDGNALDGLVARFKPTTDHDRELIKTMIATPMWGGPGGARPLFLITGDVGRGIGKTALASTVGHLYGGSIWLSQKEDVAQLKTRILSTEGLKKRLVVLDNVKSHRFSWSDLEALITAPEISGKKLYAGEGTRPNLFTYAITLNGVNLSRDLAHRAVIIKLSRPIYSGDWENETRAYIDANQSEILGDIAALLRTSGQPLQHTRWGPWEAAILCKVANPVGVQSLVKQRQIEVDADADEGSIIEDCFDAQLRALGYDTVTQIIHIPNPVSSRWMTDATGEKVSVPTATRRIKQMSNEGMLRRLKINPCHSRGRGALWVGASSSSATGVFYDLQFLDLGGGRLTFHRLNAAP